MNEHITNLKIRNYRSCRNTTVNLNEKLSVLIGKNGAGKTNILNSLLLLKQVTKGRGFRSRKIPKNYLSNAEVSFSFHRSKKVVDVKFFLVFDVTEKNSDRLVSAEVSIKNSSDKKWGKKIDIENINSFGFIHYENIKIYKHGTKSRKSYEQFRLPFDEDEYETIRSVLDFLNKIKYFSATQFSEPNKCPVTIEVNERGLNEAYGYGGIHQQFLFDLYQNYTLNNNFYKNYIELVAKSGLGLIDGIDFKEQIIENNSLEVRAGGDIRNIKNDKKIIVPLVSIDGLNLYFNQLSEGTFKTLALVFYVLKSEDEILLIEEPEVCIHHGLLTAIIELIQTKAEETQIVVSTHSDYLLDKLKPEDVILVEKKTDSGTSAKILTKLLSVNDYKALKNYLQEIGNLGDYWKEAGF